MKKLNSYCSKALKEGRCLGCQALEDKEFIGNLDCKYNKTPTARESIQQIYKQLGINTNFER